MNDVAPPFGTRFIAGFAVVAWCVTGVVACVLVPFTCGNGSGMCQLSYLGIDFIFAAVAFLLTATAATQTLGSALGERDRFSVACLAFVYAAVLISIYTILLLNGNRGDHPVLAAIYGFSPQHLLDHPVAFSGSGVVIVSVAFVLFAYCSHVAGYGTRVLPVARCSS